MNSLGLFLLRMSLQLVQSIYHLNCLPCQDMEAQTTALPTSVSFILISLVLAHDVCKPSLVMGLGGCCPCHVLPRGAGSQSSQEHTCMQKFCKKEEFPCLQFTWNFSLCANSFQTVNFEFVTESAFKNRY